jgi:hypothetical protein
MSEMIDLTPSWQGVLRLLLTAYTDGSAKGSRMALEELVRMAELADLYVAEHKGKGAKQ